MSFVMVVHVHALATKAYLVQFVIYVCKDYYIYIQNII